MAEWAQKTLLLPAVIVARIDHGLRQINDGVEIGGEMMGEVVDANAFRALAISLTRGKHHKFEYRPEEHQAEFERFFEDTVHADHGRFVHLGVWHSHPAFGPEPSAPDYAMMRDQMRKGSSSFAVMLIVSPMNIGFAQRARMLTRDGRWRWLAVEKEP